jgi:23S rRNA (pseudouridine1915-N3)-methyltransferase
MLGIKLICVGKLKEKFYLEAVQEYEKRLQAYCRLEIDEIPEIRLPANPSQSEIDTGLAKEAELIASKVPKNATQVAMCIEGQEMDSMELANMMEKYATAGISKICFMIGGSAGLHSVVKQSADLRLSMSRMTFPHHLARVMLLEQIYRGFQINTGGKYHK